MTGVVAYSNSLVRASELRVLSSVFTWSSEFFLGFLVFELFFVEKNIHILIFGGVFRFLHYEAPQERSEGF